MKRRRMSTAPRQTRGHEARKSSFVHLTITQTISCTVILCASYLLTLFQPSGYIGMRDTAIQAFSQDMNLAQVMNWIGEINMSISSENVQQLVEKTMHGIAITLNKDNSQKASESSSESSNENKKESSSTGVITESSKGNQPEASSDKAVSSSEGVSSEPQEVTNGKGGMLLVAGQESVQGTNPISPPDSAMISPIFLSATLRAPLNGTITSPFGYRLHPITGLLDFHTGIDIAAPSKTAICAALPGKVTEIGVSAIYGNYVVIDHQNGLQTAYSHCSSIIVKKNTVVRQGDRIALVGSTGISTGPHLHFELRLNGQVVDPLPHLKGVGTK